MFTMLCTFTKVHIFVQQIFFLPGPIYPVQELPRIHNKPGYVSTVLQFLYLQISK